jgi:uncharacterized protein YjiS (DUF1127 family)
MNQINSNRPPGMLRWRKVKQGLAAWRRRVRMRNELMNLSDANLQDIGTSRDTADLDACKPFWMP